MTNFTLYKFDEELNIVDLAQGDDEKLSRLFADCLTNAKQKYDYGEGGIAKTVVGIKKIDINSNSKMDDDFLEITIFNDEYIDMYSDRLIYQNLWSKFFSTKITSALNRIKTM